MEDRSFGGQKPIIDLSPVHLWGTQIEQHIGKSEWANICSFVSERVGNRCEFCKAGPNSKGLFGKRAHKFRVELRFYHDDKSRIATLKRLAFICSGCYDATHLRQAQLKSSKMPPTRSPFASAVYRLKVYHKITDQDVQSWLANELALWASRKDNGYPDQIDVDIIESGVELLWRP